MHTSSASVTSGCWPGPDRVNLLRLVMIFIRSQEDGMIHSVRLPGLTSRFS